MKNNDFAEEYSPLVSGDGHIDVEVETVLGTASQQSVIVQTEVKLGTDGVSSL